MIRVRVNVARALSCRYWPGWMSGKNCWLPPGWPACTRSGPGGPSGGPAGMAVIAGAARCGCAGRGPGVRGLVGGWAAGPGRGILQRAAAAVGAVQLLPVLRRSRPGRPGPIVGAARAGRLASRSTLVPAGRVSTSWHFSRSRLRRLFDRRPRRTVYRLPAHPPPPSTTGSTANGSPPGTPPPANAGSSPQTPWKCNGSASAGHARQAFTAAPAGPSPATDKEHSNERKSRPADALCLVVSAA